MALSARDRGRYARHLLLPEIGLAGQERLLCERVRFAAGASEEASAVAREYLVRAGLTVSARGEERLPEEPPAGEANAARVVSLPDDDAIEQLAGEPMLAHAAAALAGALAAVETLKAALGLARPVEEPWGQLSLTGAREFARVPNSEDL
jgi:hypothetical protein